jgi:hypothetical protein
MTAALQPGSSAPVPANYDVKVLEDGELKPWPNPK